MTLATNVTHEPTAYLPCVGVHASAQQAGSANAYAIKFVSKGSRVYSGRNLMASSDDEAVEKAGALYAEGKIGVHYEVWFDTVLVHVERRRA